MHVNELLPKLKYSTCLVDLHFLAFQQIDILTQSYHSFLMVDIV